MIKCKQCERISNCPYGIQDCESIISTCDEFSFDLAEHDNQVIKSFIDKLAEELYSRHSADSAWEEYSANTIIDEMIDISEKMIKC